MYKDLRNLLLLFIFLLSLSLKAGQNSNNLVLYFDASNSNSYNGSGRIINDLSTSNNDLKMMGGVTYVNSSNDIPHFNFDGNGDYLKINSAPFANSPNGLSNYTIITKLKIFCLSILNPDLLSHLLVLKIQSKILNTFLVKMDMHFLILCMLLI